MNKRLNFKEKAQRMSAHQIIMAMVNGLEKPITKINMGTFGAVRTVGKKRVCFGCAATNTICKIGGYTAKDLLKHTDQGGISRSSLVNHSEAVKDFTSDFEDAINCLRQGDIRDYNIYAKTGRFATIKKNPLVKLPALNSDFSKEDLVPYIKLANYNKRHNPLRRKTTKPKNK